MEELVFKRNRKSKNAGLALNLLAIFIALFAFFIVENNYFINFIIIATLVLNFKLLIDNVRNVSSVKVNQEGIFTRVNGIGLIKWEFIEGIEIKKLKNSMGIIFKIGQPEKLFKEKNFITVFLMKTNLKALESPVIIPKEEFDVPIETALEKIENYRNTLSL
jgi:hypothetical protein